MLRQAAVVLCVPASLAVGLARDYGLLQSKSDAKWLFAQNRLAGGR